VADAPKEHQLQHLQSLKELESEEMQRLRQHISKKTRIGTHGLPSPDRDTSLDMNLLMGELLSKHLIIEHDEFWDENLLLTAVASDLHQETEDRAAGLAKAAMPV
jgi:hypothetical protein